MLAPYFPGSFEPSFSVRVPMMQTSPFEKGLLVILILAAIGFFLQPLLLRLRIVGQARGELPTDRLGERIGRWIREVVIQGTVIAGRPIPGGAHAFVFWAFLVFLLETTDLVARMLGSPVGILGNGGFHQLYQAVVGIFAVLATVGIIYLFVRRFFLRPSALGEHLSWSSGVVALFIFVLMITYLLGAFAMSEENPLFKINAWVHILVILAFLDLIPRSKHLHLLLGLFTTFFKDFELAAIKPLHIDIEADEEGMYLGAEKFSDLGKYTTLGAFTCVECGRCYDNCPARITGKQLDPKQLMLSLREVFLENPRQEVLNDERFSTMIWQCTTCGACTFQCPVGIDQPIPIIEMRRGYVANSVFPDAMRPLFDNLESTGNPWLYQPNDAAAFISENGFPVYGKGKVLYWMGCMARYDDHYRKAAVAFSRLLNAGGVDWGVLVEEQCTGDAARRAGNEYLFQTLAETNVGMLNAADPELIVTTCPHCLRTLKEYKGMGLKKEIRLVHHAEYLTDLVAVGRLKVDGKQGGKVAYHDACYLSRYGDDRGYRNPRRLIEKAGGNIIEPERTKRKSFCCGAGGGMLFTEETEGTRVNHERVDELLKTGAERIAVACPFCQMMIRDGLGDKGREDVAVRDIAELLAECLPDPGAPLF